MVVGSPQGCLDIWEVVTVTDPKMAVSGALIMKRRIELRCLAEVPDDCVSF